MANLGEMLNKKRALIERMEERQIRLAYTISRFQEFVSCPSPDTLTRLKLAMNEYAGACDAVIAAKAALEE